MIIVIIWVTLYNFHFDTNSTIFINLQVLCLAKQDFLWDTNHESLPSLPFLQKNCNYSLSMKQLYLNQASKTLKSPLLQASLSLTRIANLVNTLMSQIFKIQDLLICRYFHHLQGHKKFHKHSHKPNLHNTQHILL